MPLFKSKNPLERHMYLSLNRVRLQPWTKKAGADWVRLRRENQDFLEPFEPLWQTLPTIALYEQRRQFYHQDCVDDKGYRFLLYDNMYRQLMGALAIFHVRRGASQCASISYWIGQQFSRQGYMKEALSLLEYFAFEQIDLHRLEAYCLPCNYASIALLKSRGFHEEGIAHHYLRIQGDWQDHLRFAKLNNSS